MSIKGLINMEELYELLIGLYLNDTVTGFEDFCWVGLKGKTLTFFPDNTGIELVYHKNDVTFSDMGTEILFLWAIENGELIKV